MKKVGLMLALLLTTAIISGFPVLAGTVTANDSAATGFMILLGTGLFGGMFFVSLCLPLLFMVFGVISTAFWVWMIVDVIERQEKDFPLPHSKDQKLIWLLIVILAGAIGALVYYLMVYRKLRSK